MQKQQTCERKEKKRERERRRRRNGDASSQTQAVPDPGLARPLFLLQGFFFFFFPFSSLINTYSSLMNTYFKELLLLLSFSDEHIFSGIAVAAVVVVFLAVVVVVFFLDVNRVLETRFSGRRHVEKVPH